MTNKTTRPSAPYTTIHVGYCDPIAGGHAVWSCPCFSLDHSAYMFRHGPDALTCLDCGVSVDRAELDDFYAKGPLFRAARAIIAQAKGVTRG